MNTNHFYNITSQQQLKARYRELCKTQPSGEKLQGGGGNTTTRFPTRHHHVRKRKLARGDNTHTTRHPNRHVLTKKGKRCLNFTI